MMSGKKVPDFFSEWTRPHTPSFRSPGGELIDSVVSIPTLLDRAQVILSPSASSTPEPTAKIGPAHESRGRNKISSRTRTLECLADLILKILALDDELEFWAHLPALTPEGATRSDAWIVGNWSFYLASRLVLNRLLEICVSHLPFTTVRSKEQNNVHGDENSDTLETIDPQLQSYISDRGSLLHRAETTQLECVEGICERILTELNLVDNFSIPPSFASSAYNLILPCSTIASYFLMWPVHVALHGPKRSIIATEKRLWLTSVLNLIAEETGFRLARAFARTPYNLFIQLESKLPDDAI